MLVSTVTGPLLNSGCRHLSLPPSVELAASGLADPLVALTFWLDFLIDTASWLLDFLDDAASWSLNLLDDAASWFVNFLDDAASWSLNLTIGPPGEVLRRLDVELWPGVKLRPCVAILIPKPS